MNRVRIEVTIFCQLGDLRMYSLDGRVVGRNSSAGVDHERNRYNVGGVYILSGRLADGKKVSLPVFRE